MLNYGQKMPYSITKIKLDELGIDDSNIHTISRYASDQYILVNEYDEAYTEYRVVKGR